MREREAACQCGQLRAYVSGDPVRVSMCHCQACQRRTGSAFGAQARFDAAQVRVEGRAKQYTRLAEEDGEPRTFSFCPDCGATVVYAFADAPDVTVVPLGAFADPGFPAPARSVWEQHRHPWVSVPDGAERHA